MNNAGDGREVMSENNQSIGKVAECHMHEPQQSVQRLMRDPDCGNLTAAVL